MGCTLIRKDLLEAVPWRDPDWLLENHSCEDIQYCNDAIRAGFAPVLIDPSLSCWHCSDDGTANRLDVGGDVFTVVWHGNGWQVSNRFGAWTANQPRYDLTVEQALLLGADFTCGPDRKLTVVTAQTSTILPLPSTSPVLPSPVFGGGAGGGQGGVGGGGLPAAAGAVPAA
jgi:hypothetical protein